MIKKLLSDWSELPPDSKHTDTTQENEVSFAHKQIPNPIATRRSEVEHILSTGKRSNDNYY